MTTLVKPDTPRKGKPYIWVTWLTKLLAGENRCWWAAWYKAHFKYAKIEETADRKQFLEDWTKKHDTMVAERVRLMKDDGYLVKMEDDAQFTLDGKTGTLSGKPDVVGMKGEHADVIDQKSGKKRESDKWQVRIYLLALPLTWLPKALLTGFVEYRDGLVEVAPLGSYEKTKISEGIMKVSSETPPPRVPSVAECKYCDILNCPDRINVAGGTTELF